MKGKRSGLLLGLCFLLALSIAVPAYAQLAAVSTQNPNAANGGIDPATGYPSWYEDASGRRLELCLTDEFCLGGNNLIDEATGDPIVGNDGQPCTAPDIANGCLPDESFYAVSRAETELNAGGRIRWRAVLEGAFANEVVQPGDNITFTRTQVTGDSIAPRLRGERLTFLTPYGNLRGTVDNQGLLNRVRLESPLGTPANEFVPPVTEQRTGYGPRFMRWDPDINPQAPPGFLGDPLIPHRAVGGDARNFFQVMADLNPRNPGLEAASPKVVRFEIAGNCVGDPC